MSKPRGQRVPRRSYGRFQTPGLLGVAMVLVLFLAAVFSSPLFFTHWWQLRWFRITWWVFLSFSVLALMSPRHYASFDHVVVAPPAPQKLTADELFGPDKSVPDKATLDAEWAAQKKRDLALSTCKVMTLNDSTLTGYANATENYFDACMASRGYRFSYADLCTATAEHSYPLGNNPAYNYVTGVLDLGSNGIEECYVEN